MLGRVDFVGLAQGLPQSHLQYTDDPLNNTIMTHSTVKCPKPAYHKEQKYFERAILLGLLRDYGKATCSTPTTHYIILSWLAVPSSAQKQHTTKSKKPLKGPYCRACSGITAKPPAVHRRPIFNPKSSLLISCLKFVSLLPISCCLCWLV